MKRYTYIFFSLIIIAINFTAYSKQAKHSNYLSSKDSFTEIEDPSRSGCCSWHGGVCGCSYGRAMCCDGQLSPSCGCD